MKFDSDEELALLTMELGETILRYLFHVSKLILDGLRHLHQTKPQNFSMSWLKKLHLKWVTRCRILHRPSKLG